MYDTIEEVCQHENRRPVILSDQSVVQDCADCEEPLVKVRDRWVTVAQSASL